MAEGAVSSSMRIVRVKRKREAAPLEDFELDDAQGLGGPPATVEDLMAQVAGVDIRANSENRILRRRVFKYVGTEVSIDNGIEQRLTIKQQAISSVDSVRQRLIEGHSSMLSRTRTCRLRLLRERSTPGQCTVLEVEATDDNLDVRGGGGGGGGGGRGGNHKVQQQQHEFPPPPDVLCSGGRMVVTHSNPTTTAKSHNIAGNATDDNEIDIYVEQEVEWRPADPNSQWHYAAAKIESFCLPPGVYSEYDHIEADDEVFGLDDDDVGDGLEVDYPPTPSSSDAEAECTNGYASADEWAYYSKHQYYVMDDDEAEESRGGHSFVEDLSSRFAGLGGSGRSNGIVQPMLLEADSDEYYGYGYDKKAKSAMF